MILDICTVQPQHSSHMMNVIKYTDVTDYKTVRHSPLHLGKLSIMANGMVERNAQRDKVTDKETQKLNLDLTYTSKKSEAE